MSHVYILQTSPSHFKIGRTTQDIEIRRKQLATGNPNDMPILYSIETEYDKELEKFLHNQFHEYLCETGDSTEHYHYRFSLEELKEKLQKAKALFDEYISYKEKAIEYKSYHSNDNMKPASDEARNLCSKLHIILGKLDNLKYEQESLENQIKVFIKDSAGIEGLATWKTKITPKFDNTSFKKDHIEIYNAYLKESKSRTFSLIAKK